MQSMSASGTSAPPLNIAVIRIIFLGDLVPVLVKTRLTQDQGSVWLRLAKTKTDQGRREKKHASNYPPYLINPVNYFVKSHCFF